jgi:hypothetical protein
MRLTVGPLPSAVYWRRRAIVLGVVVVLSFLIVQSCSGGEGKSNGNGVPTSATQGPETTPTAVIKRPQTGAPPASAGPTKAPVVPTSTPAAAASVTPSARPPANGLCTDAEVSVLPVPASTRAPRGQTIVIKLRIKNISTRACSRDVGADLQELYIKRGAEKVWSSDTCARTKGTDVQQLVPNIEREYQVAWNGRDTTRCANNVANGPVPAAGDFQVFARLGTKISAPVKLTLT